ncbi:MULTISPECIES: DUF1629 domain-containing protein [unclassified Gilliamella]|uniref:imm11 family protein n=1 Tax=unclassified Gilliamella TaxID=2685620 RepID=UPI0013083DC2|nr:MULTISPECIES: DUF1629 domain-containing protein [unclassified Gilliamella]MWP49540.1 hypothetical protein [Gilliamella sp. Lep-s35]MWP69180.1 hypothetical protein [Gilliamella sp. Lep-s5]MWP77531.1 hypothetical protein [Gilliamella sp. Lep-s21]
MNEFEYYVLERDSSNTYPLIMCDEDSEHTEEYLYDYEDEKIPEPEVMEFTFSEPYFSKPVIGDYFSQPDSVISEKIKEVLAPMNILGIQLIPATVTSNKGDIYEDYYYVHIYNNIEAMDKENSKYDKGERSYFIDKFKLDENHLKDIPLKERLIFKLAEDLTMMLYHKSVVDAIMAVNPTGLKFTKVENWHI